MKSSLFLMHVMCAAYSSSHNVPFVFFMPHGYDRVALSVGIAAFFWVAVKCAQSE